MEYFDIYDETGKKTNKQALRGTKLQDGEFQLIVNVWIRNAKGEYLIQQRNKKTDDIPYMWATTAGVVTKGDTSLETAVKETVEEIGVNLVKENLQLVKRYFVVDDYGNNIMDVYLINQDIGLDELVIDNTEVKQCKLATIQEIKTMIKNKLFWDYEEIAQDKDYFKLIEKSWSNENFIYWRCFRNKRDGSIT